MTFFIRFTETPEPSPADDFFRRLPKSESSEQQIERQLKKGKKANPLADLVGQWPGDESDEEFEGMLKMLKG